jgi:hypothetical protein
MACGRRPARVVRRQWLLPAVDAIGSISRLFKPILEYQSISVDNCDSVGQVNEDMESYWAVENRHGSCNSTTLLDEIHSQQGTGRARSQVICRVDQLPFI